MSNSMVCFTKGIVTGVVVGTTIGAVMNGLSKPANSLAHFNKHFKLNKNAGKTLRNIGTVVSHITDMMR